jgi:hypothetical protein
MVRNDETLAESLPLVPRVCHSGDKRSTPRSGADREEEESLAMFSLRSQVADLRPAIWLKSRATVSFLASHLLWKTFAEKFPALTDSY